MASTWTYSAWREQATDALRLTMLRQHMTEVANAILSSQSIGADNYNRSQDRAAMERYLEILKADEAKYEARVAGGSPRVQLTRLVRPR